MNEQKQKETIKLTDTPSMVFAFIMMGVAIGFGISVITLTIRGGDWFAIFLMTLFGSISILIGVYGIFKYNMCFKIIIDFESKEIIFRTDQLLRIKRIPFKSIVSITVNRFLYLGLCIKLDKEKPFLKYAGYVSFFSINKNIQRVEKITQRLNEIIAAQ